MSENSVLCIGLDAGSFKQISPLLDNSDLPNVKELINRGTSGVLTTTTPPWTPSAWPSVTTGATPWTHGIYDFYDHTTDDPHLVSAKDLQVPYLWEYLDEEDLVSIVINVPVTHPIHQGAKSLVPGYLAPEDTDILIDGQPTSQSLLSDDYHIYAKTTDGREAQIAENGALIKSRVEAAERLDSRQDWSFMMVQFQRTDAIFHTMGHDRDAVRRIYKRVDEAIGRLLELTDENTTVMIVSDHGIHEYERTFRFNTWLREEGWLQTTAESERHAWGETTKPTESENSESASITRQLLSTAMDTIRQLGVTPQRAEKALSLVGLAEPIRRAIPDDLLLNAAEHVDWSSSKAYCRSVSSLGVRFNVEGRDPEGVVPPGKFEAYRSELVAALKAVTAPDETPVFERVYDRHERHGNDVANEPSAPDIVVRPNEMNWKITDVVREPIFDETDEFSHTYEGMFVVTGPAIRAGADVEMKAIDVAPTILKLFGYSPAPQMDGTVPKGLLETETETISPAPEPGPRTYLGEESADSSETVTDRLEQLGYLE